MRLENIIKTDNYLLVNTSLGKIKLEPVNDRIIRIVYTRRENFSDSKSLLVIPQADFSGYWEYNDDEEFVSIKTSMVQIIINKETCAFTYLDAAGNLLTKEPKRGGKALTEIDIVKNKFEYAEKPTKVKTVDGERFFAESTSSYVDRSAYHTKLEFEWEKDEAIYGLGQHEEGIINYRGHHQLLYQANMKISIPIILSTRGYGVFVDSCSLMTFHDDQHGSYLWSDADDEMDYYFIYGPEFDMIVNEIRKLTGEASMLPKWAFGYIQSKEHYKTSEELIDTIQEYRNRNIPIDCIVQDWKSWEGDLWGQKSFDKTRFPDPKVMMEKLHDLNAKLMISIWPNMASDGKNHDEMRELGFLLGDYSTYDAFNPKARETYWDQTNEGLFSYGVDAWWCDSTEPFSPDWKGESKLEPFERIRLVGEEFKKYLDAEYVNAYSLMHSKGIYEGQRKITHSKRVVNLIRSSYPGQQKYGTITWSGDISATWEVMKKQIAEGLNFCATGLPYWTLDIGAFFVGGIANWRKWCDNDNATGVWFWNGDYDKGCMDNGYKELYLRWFQFGTFLPVFRSHGTDTPREVWRFGEKGTVFYDTLVKFIETRYKLLPYIYSLTGMVTHNSYTMMRLLAFDFRNDAKVYDIDDQYMFGPALLVNPVTQPMYYGSESKELVGVEKKRNVYLPSGFTWYDFWTAQAYCGGHTYEVNTPLDIMPVFVKSGSIVPIGPIVQHTSEKSKVPMELSIYGGNDGEFVLYEDEGDNYNYENGEFSTIGLQWNDNSRQLTIGKRVGCYNGMLLEREFKIRLVYGTSTDNFEKAELEQIIRYSGIEIKVSI